MIRTSPLPTEKSLFAAFSSQVSTPEAIFSSKMANSATQIAGNTVDGFKVSTVAEYHYVLQIKSDQQLFGHNIKTCHTISFRKQIKGNVFQWPGLETTF